MMKLLSIFLLVLVTIIVSCNATQQNQTYYINIYPYQNSCSGVPTGVGFSVKIGECINNMGEFLNIGGFDYNSWIFKYQVTESGKYLFSELYFEQNCDSNSGYPVTFSYTVNTCIDSAVYIDVNATVNGNFGLSQNTFISLTTQPDLPNNSQIYAVYSFNDDPIINNSSSSTDSSSGSEEPICELENFLYATTISNALSIDYANGIKQTFSCSAKQEPTVNYCAPGKKCYNKHVAKSCSNTNSPGFTQNTFCTK